MRKINLIVVHCSDSDHPKHDDMEVIRDWHMQKGWSDIGYHFYIKSNGDLQLGRYLSVIGSHVKGHNRSSVGICLSGKTIFTSAQMDTLERLCLNLMDVFNLEIKDILGHCELNNGKTCPNFDIHKLRQKLVSRR